MNKRLMMAALSSAALSGCANAILSDDRIQSNTAMALHVSPERVQISDRRYDGGVDTFYVATVGRRSYSCVINGGTVMSLGMTNAPQCSLAS